MKAAFNETLWVGTLQYTTQNYISFCYAILKARMYYASLLVMWAEGAQSDQIQYEVAFDF